MTESETELQGSSPSGSEQTACPPSQGCSQELLRGNPQVVLERLTQGDPLGLALRVRRYLYGRRFLMDEERIVLATTALVARNAPRYRGRPTLERWLDRQIESCAEAHRYGVDESRSKGVPVGKHWARLARGFGLEPEALDCACRRFHGLPFESREAFFRLVLERRSIESLVYRGGRQAPEIAKEARRALSHFIHLKPNRVNRHGHGG
mgnify:CR=1 FL=1